MRASAPSSTRPRRNRPMSDVFETVGLAESPFMPVFPAPQRMFVRGQGTELYDIDGQALPRLPLGDRRHVIGPCQPGGGGGNLGAGRRAAPRQQLLRQPAGDRRRRRRRRAGRRSRRPPRSCLLRQQRRRGDRVRDQARPQARWTRSSHGGQRVRQLSWPDAGRLGGDGSAEQARTVSTDAGGLPPRRLG